MPVEHRNAADLGRDVVGCALDPVRAGIDERAQRHLEETVHGAIKGGAIDWIRYEVAVMGLAWAEAGVIRAEIVDGIFPPLGDVVFHGDEIAALRQVRERRAVGNEIALIVVRLVLVQVAVHPLVAIVRHVGGIGPVAPLIQIVAGAIGEARVGGVRAVTRREQECFVEAVIGVDIPFGDNDTVGDTVEIALPAIHDGPALVSTATEIGGDVIGGSVNPVRSGIRDVIDFERQRASDIDPRCGDDGGLARRVVGLVRRD